MITDIILYGIGLIVLLTIYLPFSPMTIDIVNITRDAQISIHKNRRILWLIAIAALAAEGLRVLAGAADISGLAFLGTATQGWLIAWVITVAMAVMMFWMSYVPYVMSPPANPSVMSAEDGDKVIRDEDVVLGVTGGGDARAYPRDTISRPHYFEDTVGGQRLVISYCILCNSGIGFKAAIGERDVSLTCVTAYNNNIIYIDEERQNYIQQLDGAVIDGPDKGQKLELYPLAQTTWGEWKATHPNTRLYYSPSTSLRDKMMDIMLKLMMPVPKLAKRSKPWHRVRGAIDKRLPAMAYTLGVEIDGDACGYATTQVEEKGLINNDVGGAPIVLVHNQGISAAEIFSRRVGGRDLTFERAGDTVTDKETGSTWSLTGKATDGDLAGQQLEAVPHYNKLFWFSWSVFKPHTRIYGVS
jgi:hypothetical protein